MVRRPAFALCLVLAAVSSARADDPPALDRREKGDLAIQARAILRKYCGECHGGGQGPSTLSVLDHKQLVAKGPTQGPIPFVSIDGPPRSQVIEFVEDGSMPPGGRPRPSDAELTRLREWVAARAPSYPRAFDEQTTLAVMLADWEAQKEADRPHLRYLSFAHLIGDGEIPNLRAATQKLQKALLFASGKQHAPEPVDDTATLYRLDVRTLGWDTPDLFDRVEKGAIRPDAFPMIPFDLLTLEYPYSVAPSPRDPLATRLAPFFAATRQLRPVPFVQADWVSEVLAPNSPLAADMKSLTELGDANKKGAADPCGPPVRPFAGLKPLKLPAVDGRPPSPPLSAWYAGDVSAAPEPFALSAEVYRTDDKPTAEVVINEPFKLHVRADRDVRFVLLNVLSTGDVRAIPVAGGNVLKKGVPRDLTPSSGAPFEVSSSLTGADKFTEHFVLIAAETDPPAVRIVRSRHSLANDCERKGLSPVWRFVTEDPRASEFDPARAVRKVIPLTITRKKA